MNELRTRTPMMQQYFGAREDHPGVILLMRVGDFYEAYGDDAVTIAAALNITLTSRQDSGEAVAMAGVPHHAAERYVARLIKQGHRVAMMEQLEDPKLAKGLVKRGVTRVLSRGTVFEDSLLEARSNNFLVAVSETGDAIGICVTDVSTGEFIVTELSGADRERHLLDELGRLNPVEMLINGTNDNLEKLVKAATDAPITPFTSPDRPRSVTPYDMLCAHFKVSSLRGFGCEELEAAQRAAILTVDYLRETHTGSLDHITALSTYHMGDFMMLDPQARRHLEISSAMGEGGRAHTLLGAMDETKTSMGARTLRRWLEEPLMDVGSIDARLDAIHELAKGELLRGDVRELLKGINDIERLVARCAAGLASPRDLSGLRDSLEKLPSLSQLAGSASTSLLRTHAISLHPESAATQDLLAVAETTPQPFTPSSIAARLRQALVDEPPNSIKDGGLIREGFSLELDALRKGGREGRVWIATLEETERAKTGIASLKVGYNSVFGYYIEVTKTNLAKVPETYIRKQTTANAERYITPELKEMEAQILGSDERAIERELSIFADLKLEVARASDSLLTAARSVAVLDTLAGLAETAVRYRYVRPIVHNGSHLKIRGGRHPVVERLRPAGAFVPNDCNLDGADHRMMIITGPNMAGKSTVLRQVALITLLAQVGSFVPADSAEIPLADRIFTRVGAHDELASGQSTFMVEMNETAGILNNATDRSLVILDEIGRGTSTYDGLSIAWAVAEHLLDVGAKTLFATHYHHLNELAKSREGVQNYRVTVKEEADQIRWLHKLVPGGTDRSYGIQVARMAGVPPSVVERAREILVNLEKSGAKVGPGTDTKVLPQTIRKKLQLTLFEEEKHPVIEELLDLDVSSLTPVEALMKLDELVRRCKH